MDFAPNSPTIAPMGEERNGDFTGLRYVWCMLNNGKWSISQIDAAVAVCSKSKRSGAAAAPKTLLQKKRR